MIEIDNAIENLSAIKSLDTKLLRLETSMRRKLMRFFKLLEKDVISKIEKNPNMAEQIIQETIKEHREKYEEIIEKSAVSSASYGSKHTSSLILKAGMELKTNEISPKVLALITGTRLAFVDDTMLTVNTALLNILKKGYEEGLGINDIAKDIKEKFPSYSKNKAKMLARTEINGASNQACYETLTENGVKYQMWLTAGDERVRRTPPNLADHVKLNRQIVKVGSKFSNGLLYPHDGYNGSMAEIGGCRCTIIPYFVPFGFSAPIGRSYFYENELIKVS